MIGSELYSRVNGKSWTIGHFETPTLAELRQRATTNPKVQALKSSDGRRQIRLSAVVGEVSSVQASYPLSLVQAASQFNCLEFVGPGVEPEDGITAYVADRTQGPACSVGCGPATVFRNYFASPVGSSQIGQTKHQMINNLLDLNARVGNVPDGRFFKVKHGYTLASDDGLHRLNQALAKFEEKGADGLQQLRDLLRIGVHQDVQVTSSNWGRNLIEDRKILITQVFGSACSVSYSRNPGLLWAPFARLVLEASYEATLYAALENAARHDGQLNSKVVFLTLLGGGVFGNSLDWIAHAIERACLRLQQYDLDVRVVSYSYPDPEITQMVKQFNRI